MFDWALNTSLSTKHCVKSVQRRSFFWSVSSRILRISPYSVRMWENTDQKKLRIWTLFTQWQQQQQHFKSSYSQVSWNYNKNRMLNSSSSEQESFKSKTEWVPFKCLYWNTNDLYIKLMFSITSSVSLWYRPCYKNIWNYDNDNKCRKLTTI